MYLINMKNNHFGTTLKELRIENGLSQTELGQKLGYCNQTISFWENGQREPSLDALVSVATYFGVSTDFLLGIDRY